MAHAAVLVFLALLFAPHVRAKAGVATQQRDNAGRMCFLSLVVLEAAAPAIDAPLARTPRTIASGRRG